MSRNLRNQMYTTKNPDGSIITTTTNLKSNYIENGDKLVLGRGILNERYCSKPIGIIRIVEIVLGLIIVSLITSVFGPGPFKGILFAQTIFLFLVGVAFCLTFIFLIVFFFNLQKTHLFFWPWRVSDFIFSLTACIIFFLMGIVESYYSTGAWSNNCNDIGGDGIIHNGCRLIYEWAFAAFFAFVNSGCYGFSAALALYSKHDN